MKVGLFFCGLTVDFKHQLWEQSFKHDVWYKENNTQNGAQVHAKNIVRKECGYVVFNIRISSAIENFVKMYETRFRKRTGSRLSDCRLQHHSHSNMHCVSRNHSCIASAKSSQVPKVRPSHWLWCEQNSCTNLCTLVTHSCKGSHAVVSIHLQTETKDRKLIWQANAVFFFFCFFCFFLSDTRITTDHLLEMIPHNFTCIRSSNQICKAR